MSDRVKLWTERTSWGCAAVGVAGVLGYLGLRVWMGFGLSPRYALGRDDGGPLFYAGALLIIPVSIIGGVLASSSNRRAALIANSVVLAIFLGYGALGLLLL